jgi:methylthioribulose-1-phosphate dehydratase
MDRDVVVEALIATGRQFHARGWVPATGGNFSSRLRSDRMLVTRSGVHKGELEAGDFLETDLQGRPTGAGTPSYETGLHALLYRLDPAIGCVLHTHSIANTVLSRRTGIVALQGFELQKLLPGAPDPAQRLEIPVFANDQDIARLSGQVEAALRQQPKAPAYLLAGHGLYAWGDDVRQARHRVEALEFMLECTLREVEGNE